MLLVAAVVTFLLEYHADAAVILGVVIINALIGFVQEGKAEQALAAVRAMLASKATVLRDGSRREIDALELVPGDIVLLESGARVPADLRLLKVKNLRVNEAALTGESVPAEKASAAVSATASPATALGWPTRAPSWPLVRVVDSWSPLARRLRSGASARWSRA